MLITEVSTGTTPLIFGQNLDWPTPAHFKFIIPGRYSKIYPLIKGYQIGYSEGDHHLERAQVSASVTSTSNYGPDTQVAVDLSFHFNDDGGGIFPTDETLLMKVDILLVVDDGMN